MTTVLISEPVEKSKKKFKKLKEPLEALLLRALFVEELDLAVRGLVSGELVVFADYSASSDRSSDRDSHHL